MGGSGPVPVAVVVAIVAPEQVGVVVGAAVVHETVARRRELLRIVAQQGSLATEEVTAFTGVRGAGSAASLRLACTPLSARSSLALLSVHDQS